MTNDNTDLTIFDPDEKSRKLLIKERAIAVNRFIAGKTPIRHIKYREGNHKGVADIPYVTGSYLIRQVGLVTGFKWSHRVLQRRTLPDWWKAVTSIQNSSKDSYTKDEVVGILTRCIQQVPREIMTDIELTVYDAQDRPFVHTATGVNKVKYLQQSPTTPVSIGNAEKGSETDAIKKALASMGFCPDVYGPKEELDERLKSGEDID